MKSPLSNMVAEISEEALKDFEANYQDAPLKEQEDFVHRLLIQRDRAFRSHCLGGEVSLTTSGLLIDERAEVYPASGLK